MEGGEQAAGFCDPGQALGHRGGQPWQEGCLEQELLRFSIGPPEDLACEVVEQRLGPCPAPGLVPYSPGLQLLEEQHEPGGPAIRRIVERVDSVPRQPRPAH